MYIKPYKNLTKNYEKNIILAIASLAFAIKSNGSYARSKLRNNNYSGRSSSYYIGFSGVNNYYDLLGSHDIVLNINDLDIPIPIINNLSLGILGGGIEAGYNMKFNNILVGVGLSYIYTSPNIRYFDKTLSSELEKDLYKQLVEVIITSFFQNINCHRINLDASVGYLFENKVTLYAGGIISYNLGKPQNAIPKFEYEGETVVPGFNKKFTSNFGFGFKVGTDIKLTEHLSFNISYRMTWFDTTNDYKEYVEFVNRILKELKVKIRTLGFADIDKMITAGIRYNF